MQNKNLQFLNFGIGGQGDAGKLLHVYAKTLQPYSRSGKIYRCYRMYIVMRYIPYGAYGFLKILERLIIILEVTHVIILHVMIGAKLYLETRRQFLKSFSYLFNLYFLCSALAPKL